MWHLAAVYDLGVPRDVGMRVNVEGTRHVLRFAEGCPEPAPPPLRQHLLRQRPPLRAVPRDRPRRGPGVQQLLRGDQVPRRGRWWPRPAAAGMPTSVYRPAIVVGDSRTGDTQKFDGPVLPAAVAAAAAPARWPSCPLVGDPTMARFNMVPSDFVVDAIEHLSGARRLGRPHLPARRPPAPDRRRAADRDVPGHRSPGRAGPAAPAAHDVGARPRRPAGSVASASRPTRSSTSSTPPTTTPPRPTPTWPAAASPAPRCPTTCPTWCGSWSSTANANLGVMV